jgi:hypothetical protein
MPSGELTADGRLGGWLVCSCKCICSTSCTPSRTGSRWKPLHRRHTLRLKRSSKGGDASHTKQSPAFGAHSLRLCTCAAFRSAQAWRQVLSAVFFGCILAVLTLLYSLATTDQLSFSSPATTLLLTLGVAVPLFLCVCYPIGGLPLTTAWRALIAAYIGAFASITLLYPLYSLARSSASPAVYTPLFYLLIAVPSASIAWNVMSGCVHRSPKPTPPAGSNAPAPAPALASSAPVVCICTAQRVNRLKVCSLSLCDRDLPAIRWRLLCVAFYFSFRSA